MNAPYNALKQFSEMRKRVVSDIPEDIDFNVPDIGSGEKDLLSRGIPLAHRAVLSVYENVSDCADNGWLTSAIIQSMEKKGGVMKCNRGTRARSSTPFLYRFLPC